jgi:guanine deaminase
MHLAVEEAVNGAQSGHGGPFGSVIVKDGKVIAKGHSMVLKTKNPTQHSDMVVIAAAGQKLGTFDLADCDLYTTSEPYPMCLSAALWANIANIYFGVKNKDTIEIGHRMDMFKGIVCLEGQSLVNMQQLGYEMCRKVLDEYKKNGKKIMY